LQRHRRRDPRCAEDEERAGIEQSDTVVLKQMAVAHERRTPGAVAVEVGILQPASVGQGPSRGCAHGRALGQDRVHPVAGRERLALLDPDRSEQT
jgi:hypothetical protein